MNNDEKFQREAGKRTLLAADTAAVEDLFDHAVCELRDGDEFLSGDFVSALHRRGGMRCFQLAVEHCEGADPIERQIGALVLGQLGYAEDKPFAERSFATLEKLLVDGDEDVIDCAVTALGHLRGVESILKFPELAAHENGDIRFSVAVALGGSSNPDAVSALIRLAHDPSALVRDWAVFGLGTQNDLDTPELREILLASLTDDDEIVRGEALVGLAKRGDTRVIPYLIEEMKADEVDYLVMQAASAIASPELIPALQGLRGKDIIKEDVLEDVIVDCSGVVRLHDDR